MALTEVKVRSVELFQAIFEGLSSASMVAVVEFGGEEDRLAGDTRGLDALANLGFIAIGSSSINVLVAVREGELYSFLDGTRLRFPGT